MSRPLVFRLSIVLAALLAPGVLPAPAEAGQNTADEHKQLRADLAHLEKQLGRRKAENEDLTTYLKAVAKSVGSLEGEARVVDPLRKKILDVHMKAISLERIVKEENIRAEVNILAATSLGGLAPKLTKKERARLAKTLEVRYLALRDVKHDEPSIERIHATAILMGTLGQDRTVSFFQRKFLRTDNKDIEFTVGALRGLLQFKDLAPTRRFELFERIKRQYEGVESIAKQSANTANAASKKRFWDHVRTDVIALMQMLARTPTNKQGEALNTVKDFQAWFREHDNVRGAPWTLDDGKTKTGGK